MFKKAILVIVIFLFSGCFDGRIENVRTIQNNTSIKVSFKKAKTKEFNIKLEDESKVLVLNFFTTFCGACKEEFSSLNELAITYKKDIKVLGILGQKISAKKANDFIKEYRINYNVVSEASSVNLFSSAVGDVFGVPVTYIFDKKGILRHKFLGYVPHDTLKKAILQII